VNAFPTGVAFAEALAIVEDVGRRRGPMKEAIAVDDALGRIAAEPVVASMPLPPFDNSAMDGFAFRHADLPLAAAGLRIVGDQFAGRRLAFAVGRGDCVRVTTGAALPSGSDTVVIREAVCVEDGRAHFEGAIRPGAHVRRAGEDVRAGETVIEPGVVLTPGRLAMLASLGQAGIGVARQPSVAVITTGDELVEPGRALAPGEIHDSNRTLLCALLRAQGLQPATWPTVADDPAALEVALRQAASTSDLVITCGGVSAGEKDFIPDLVRSHGRILFWKVRMKPGMPVLFGSLGDAHLLALPGNPVSVLATWLTLGCALTDALQGRTEPRPRWKARMAARFDKRNARLEFLRGRLWSGPDAMLQVTPDPADGSHRLAAAARADVLIVLPEGERAFEPGDVVDVLPL
jgi:molybdopterin molybdotransferase